MMDDSSKARLSGRPTLMHRTMEHGRNMEYSLQVDPVKEWPNSGNPGSHVAVLPGLALVSSIEETPTTFP
jgi:hypothetical protein